MPTRLIIKFSGTVTGYTYTGDKVTKRVLATEEDLEDFRLSGLLRRMDSLSLRRSAIVKKSRRRIPLTRTVIAS